MNKIILSVLAFACYFNMANCQIISTVAGGTGSGDSARVVAITPNYVLADNAGNIYVSNYFQNDVVEINSATQIATTIAGTGSAEGFWSFFNGDGMQGTATMLYSPAQIAIDNAGNIYVADQYNYRIRKISTTGIVTTVVGSAVGGYSGDGGPATAAEIGAVSGLAMDKSGNMYFSDVTIRKVNTSGIINTIAGLNYPGFIGDGGPATAAEFNSPSAVAIDGIGNMYVADFGNSRIRMVNTSGIVNTIAGNGVLGFSGDGGPATDAELNAPRDVKVDKLGNIYISDEHNSRIRMVNTSGIINTVAGNGAANYSGDGGSAIAAEIGYPCSFSVDSSGNFYIADSSSNNIRMVNSSGIISTVAGNGYLAYSGNGKNALGIQMFAPVSVSFDNIGNMLIADQYNYVIWSVSPSGVASIIAGIPSQIGVGSNGMPATAVGLYNPARAVSDKAGNIYIAGNCDNSVRKINTSGIINAFAGQAYVGAYGGDGGPATAAYLSHPYGISWDRDSNVYISDLGNYVIRKVNTSGIISTVVGTPTVMGYSGDGGPATAAEIGEPMGTAFDTGGNLYIADYEFSCIRVVNTSGIIETYIGTAGRGFSGDGGPASAAELSSSSDVSFDVQGNMYIADFGNNRIRMVNTSGIINTVAGYSSEGYSGDGGNPLNAELFRPASVMVTNAGTIYIADTYNGRIREVNGIITQENDLSLTSSKLKIYPNPSNGQITLEWSVVGGQSSVRISIYDELGQMVYDNNQTQITGKNSEQINLENLSSGIYSLRMQTNNSITVKKLVVMKK